MNVYSDYPNIQGSYSPWSGNTLQDNDQEIPPVTGSLENHHRLKHAFKRGICCVGPWRVHTLIGKMLVPLGWYPSCLPPQGAL